MTRRISGIAVMAVLAMGFAIPAAASADWTDGTVKVGSNANITLNGSLNFGSAHWALNCSQVHAEGTLMPGSEGHITWVRPSLSGCVFTGALAGCTAWINPHSLPWPLHITGSAIGWKVNTHLSMSGAFCPYKTLNVTGEITATPDNTHAMTKLTLSSSAGAIEWFNGEKTVLTGNASGTMNVTPSGTYGIT